MSPSVTLVSSWSRYRMSSSLRYTFTNLCRPPESSTSWPASPGYREVSSPNTSPTVAPSAATEDAPSAWGRSRVGGGLRRPSAMLQVRPSGSGLTAAADPASAGSLGGSDRGRASRRARDEPHCPRGAPPATPSPTWRRRLPRPDGPTTLRDRDLPRACDCAAGSLRASGRTGGRGHAPIRPSFELAQGPPSSPRQTTQSTNTIPARRARTRRSLNTVSSCTEGRPARPPARTTMASREVPNSAARSTSSQTLSQESER